MQEIDPNDLYLFNKLVPDRQPQPVDEEGERINLADLILEKIAAHEAAHGGEGFKEGRPLEDVNELPTKVKEVYSKYVSVSSR